MTDDSFTRLVKQKYDFAPLPYDESDQFLVNGRVMVAMNWISEALRTHIAQTPFMRAMQPWQINYYLEVAQRVANGQLQLHGRGKRKRDDDDDDDGRQHNEDDIIGQLLTRPRNEEEEKDDEEDVWRARPGRIKIADGFEMPLTLTAFEEDFRMLGPIVVNPAGHDSDNTLASQDMHVTYPSLNNYLLSTVVLNGTWPETINDWGPDTAMGYYLGYEVKHVDLSLESFRKWDGSVISNVGTEGHTLQMIPRAQITPRPSNQTYTLKDQMVRAPVHRVDAITKRVQWGDDARIKYERYRVPRTTEHSLWLPVGRSQSSPVVGIGAPSLRDRMRLRQPRQDTAMIRVAIDTFQRFRSV